MKRFYYKASDEASLFISDFKESKGTEVDQWATNAGTREHRRCY